ncbi:MAG: acyltransferase [Bacteroidales bacterium]|nr:acyltransferase [Bacteroidales bacterium]
MQQKREPISPIYGLRFILALGVVLYHMGMTDATVMKMMMAAFFVMSGFFMEMHHGCSQLSLRQWGRIEMGVVSKIYPLQWLCLLVWVAFSSLEVTWAIVPSMLLVQSWIPDPTIYFYANVVSWFVSTLAFSYVLFPLLSWGSRKVGFRLRWAVMLALVGLMAYLNVAVEEHYYRHIFPPARVVDFLLGVLLCQLVPQLKDSSVVRRLVCSAAPVLEVIIVVVSVAACVWLDHHCAVMVAWIIISAMLLLATLEQYHGVKGLVFRLLSLRWLVRLGQVSFEIYMIHMIVFLMMNRVLPLPSGSPLCLCLKFVALFAVAFATHYCFVKPVGRFLVSRLCKE